MQHESQRVPVTALAFQGQNVVLAGEGPYLKAYSVRDKTSLGSARVFEDQAVRGILSGSNSENGTILVWGGNFLRAVRLRALAEGQTQTLRIEQGQVFKVADWILDASVESVGENAPSRVAIVTAHNALLLADLDSASLELNVHPVAPGSNCILYCAHITWLSASQCLIASGTAFGDIIVWSCRISQSAEDISATHQVHYTFSAHQGSVFGVQIASHDIAQSLAGRQHVLASCSDDRTICLWDISDLTVKSASLAEEQRETGFGFKQSASSHAPQCLAKVMGHVSRIWHVRLGAIGREGSSDDVRIFSFGEDASCIAWVLQGKDSGEGSMKYQLKQDKIIKAHSGKHIWSVANDGCRRLATGGADGAVALTSGKNATDLTRLERSNSAYGSISGAFRSFAFVSSSDILGISETGQVTIASLQASGASTTEIPVGNAHLKGYSVTTGIPGFAFFAGTDGVVYAYGHKSRAIKTIAHIAGKVASIFAQDVDCGISGNRSVVVLFASVASQQATLLHLQETAVQAPEELRELHQPYALQLSRGFVITSFAQSTYCERTLIALGARNGCIAIFSLSAERLDTPIHAAACQVSHGKEAVTSLQLSRSNASGRGTMSVLSVGRDGTCAVQMIALVGDRVELETVHQLTLPFGPNIEGIHYSTSGRLHTWAFRSKHFVVFDILAQREIMTVECGGVHRNWKYLPQEEGGTFLWTQASELRYQTQRNLEFETINSGGHGREIKTIAVSSVDHSLVATGAEDTNIKLHRYDRGRWLLLHTLQRHVTGIQHLVWARDGRYLFSSGGFEDFFVWRLRSNVAAVGIGVVCESAHVKSGTSDLRIMSFDVQQRHKGIELMNDLDEFRITMVYSDSTIRTWRYSERTWTVLSEGEYLTSCLTQSLHLDKDNREILTASTDGYLALWKTAENSIKWTCRIPVHQNAILSLLQQKLPDGSILMISGGDDNALGLTRLCKGGEQWNTLLIPRAHAAAVTGVAVIAVKDKTIWLASASIDQRIKVWRIKVDVAQPGVEGVDVELLKNVFTAVADVSGLEKVELPEGHVGVLVCGVGLDLWRIDGELAPQLGLES